MQIEFLKENGVTVIYRHPQDVDSCIRSLRAGDELWLTTLDRLSNTRKAMATLVDNVHARDAVIVEAFSKRRSDNRDDCVRMILEAIDALASDGRALPTALAKEFGRRGGAALKAAAAAKRMPDAEAKMIWLNNSDLSVSECLALMPGWTQRLAYRQLGKRGLAKGRPSGRMLSYRRRDGEPPNMHVYFVRSGSKGPVKIGTTSNLERRVNGLSHPLVKDMRLLAAIEGGYGVEKSLHRQFAEYRIKGEWFKMEGKLAAYIATLPKWKPKTQ